MRPQLLNLTKTRGKVSRTSKTDMTIMVIGTMSLRTHKTEIDLPNSV